MKHVLLQAAMKLHNAYRTKAWWRWTVRTLAVLVVFFTTYALILPALTMQSQSACGMVDHVHTDECYEAQTVCTVHTHDDACYDDQSVLTCLLLETTEHTHTDECTQNVLVCNLTEHIHTNECNSEDQQIKNPYTCGIGEHTHSQLCADGESCSIPEHIHEAACMVTGLDLTADTETRQQWEQSLAQVEYTGVWEKDLVAVAESQLGYTESEKNAVLDGDALNGYTRYGAWYGQPYGDWNSMFVAFCLHYAEITEEYIPYYLDAEAWTKALTQKGLYKEAGAHTPTVGNLIFTDTDRDGKADCTAIVSGVVGNGTVQIIAGDAEKGKVLLQAVHEGIVGYAVLPENPMTQEQWAETEEVKALVQGLPTAEDIKSGLQSLNDQGDRAGYEALRQELLNRIDVITEKFDGFNDLQKKRTGSLDGLDSLKEACNSSWAKFPALTDDSAVVTGLTEDSMKLLQDTRDEAQPENTVRNGDSIEYTFTVDTESYYSDVQYGQAYVKLELVLPVEKSRASFDKASLDWLENSRETVQTQKLNGVDTACQVLTGYKKLTADDINGVVVPGSFTQTVSVQVQNMAHGSKLAVIISAAMEHGTWEGLCQTHRIEEKLTIVTDTLLLYAPLPAEKQQENYENYLQKLEAESADLEQLQKLMAEAYAAGALSEEQYSLLHQRALELAGVDLNSIAEPSVGDGWVWMDFAVNDLELDTVALTTTAQTKNVPTGSAMPQKLYRSLGLDSNSQIPENGWGGENSADDVIWVSKTIEGTEQENVFDITLQVITKEKINEVYKEPDMAVVIVMDISNTMTSVFSGEKTITRYDAAMTSAQHFLESFADKTDGISRVGYVAFNTHAHEVFAMQECSTTAQAKALSNTMRNKTASIMTTAANKTTSKKYADSHERFTNMQAGLKMAQNMLKNVDNRHKYIIFLSDGFPTTYLKSGYTGYDPYTDSGSNKVNGVFYDNVMKVHCDYGTSYSDTAAIKARELAVTLKKDGINIFSIGVDVAGQTIKYYHDSSVNNMKTFSVVERRESVDYYNTTGYEIGTLHKEIVKANPTAAEKAAMAQDFKDWLKGTATGGIGSGYYYDSTDLTGLERAYSSIFAKILEMNAESAHLDWVATDPMPDMGVHELDTVEFIGFWDINNVLQQVLVGQSKDDSLYLNTATFDTAASTIHWDLKNSGYQSVSFGNNKNYLCAMKYRVRLRNENGVFIEKQIYDTNDTTFLNYRIIEVKDGVTGISDSKYIEFPIPKVFGYLSELEFMKVTNNYKPLPGAGFTLTHDTQACGTCRGDGISTVQLPAYEASSGADGMVKFTNIPSGHHYILTETKTPEGYITTKNTYRVEIAYDAQTVTVLDADGRPLEWTSTIKNDTYYALPKTGGAGIYPFTFAGLFLLLTALMYVCITCRKHRKGTDE